MGAVIAIGLTRRLCSHATGNCRVFCAALPPDPQEASCFLQTIAASPLLGRC